jgi:hypothetical protein
LPSRKSVIKAIDVDVLAVQWLQAKSAAQLDMTYGV